LKLNKYKVLAKFSIEIIIFFILEFNIFARIEGIVYLGIMLNIEGICIFVLFSVFSFQNRRLIILLKIIIKIAGGIKYIHMICFNILNEEKYFTTNLTLQCSIIINIFS
jgi:hypothetical protein